MGYQDAPGGGGKLSLASVGFAGPGAGAGGGGYKELLSMALPTDYGLDGGKVAEAIGVRLPDVGGAVRLAKIENLEEKVNRLQEVKRKNKIQQGFSKSNSFVCQAKLEKCMGLVRDIRERSGQNVAFTDGMIILETREAREFASGALAGAMSKAILAPLETIRTRMVVGVGSRHILGSLGEIIEQNGWQGLWAGNAINMLRIIPTQAVELGTFECVKRRMIEAQEKWKEDGYPKIQLGNFKIELPLHFLSPVAIAGAAAGIAGTLACHPLEVIKDRLTINREVYPSISLAFSKIYKTDGIGGLYAGLCPTLIGMLPYSTCYYFMYDTIKTSYCRFHKKSSLSRPELLIIGAFSGLTASTISFPLEVARKRLMVGVLQGKCPPNMIAALSEVIRVEGFLGLYRGWGASCLKVMPNSGITWVFYEAWKDILLSDRDMRHS